MKIKILGILVFLVLPACGEPESAAAIKARSSVVNGPSAPPPVAVKPSLLKIKGLYIGMDIQTVPNVMVEILADQQLSGFSFTDAMPTGEGGQCVLMYTKPFLHAIEARMHERYGAARAQAKVDEEILTSCVNSDGVLTVRSDAAGKVTRIEFNDVKDIFGATGQSAEDFARKLSAEYHFPAMKTDETKTSWVHVGEDGTRVAVESKEVLGIPMLRLYMSNGSK